MINHCEIHPEVMGSDHCPVSASYKLTGLGNSKNLPNYCTKNFAEFSGNQQKLSSYFKVNAEKRKLECETTVKNTSKKKLGQQQSNISNFFIKK